MTIAKSSSFRSSEFDFARFIRPHCMVPLRNPYFASILSHHLYQAGNGVLKGRELPPNERSLSLNATLSFSSTPGRSASTRTASAFSPHLDQALPLCPRLKSELFRLPLRRP